MAISVKFTKFDNTPWGFRLAGGSDFPQPLTVIRVAEGSLAECMGLKVGDVVVRLNDQPIGGLTHGQAHEELMRAGNNFVLGVQREEDPHKALEGLSEENIVPYKIPLADLPPVFPEQILTEETVIERVEESTYEEVTAEAEPEVEPLPDKPKDENSEIVPNQNLTDDEIAQLILEEEELLDEKGVLGVNFKKLRPRATVLRQSKVIEELQSIATAEPPIVEQLKRTSVFLQKPQRPIPQPRKRQDEEETEVEAYRVVITKQKKRTVTDRLLEKGLLKPEPAKTPEPNTPEVNMDSSEIAPRVEEDDSPASLTVPSSPPEDDPSSRKPPVERIADTNLSPACSETELTPSDSSVDVSEREASASPAPEVVELRQDFPTDVSDVAMRVATDVAMDVTNVVTVATDAAKDVATDVAQAPKRRDAAPARKPATKRKPKRFYTKGHYFRRCLFGKKSHGDKKPNRAKSPTKEHSHWENGSDGAGQTDARRGSIEKSPRSRMRGRYLESYLKRMIDGLLEKPDSFSKKQFSRRRTRYAEKILARSIEFVAVRFRSDVLAYLEYGGSRDALNPAGSNPRVRERLYFKGRYLERILWRNIARLLNYVKGVPAPRDAPRRDRRRSSTMLRMKGRYIEKCLFQNGLLDRAAAARRPSVVSSKKKLFARTRYVERILKKHLESLGLIVGYIRKQILQGISDSSVCVPKRSAAAPRREQEDRAQLSDLLRSSKDFISTEVFHRGSRRLSRSSCRPSVSAGSPGILTVLRSLALDWLPSKLTGRSTDRETIAEKKAASMDADRERRRLSFVPTVLYEGLTNRIGVDFTRLVAYAFVPCTSIILLYMYK
ncbi:uncharacterized protein LOC116428376 isoform X1 [Nomia melanderi]|uniref:uncharacterized protein LOC116428376 isoform X1 n=1 Tax=Nomia melanderi TaxID=2448451 RepID=UPI003FCD9764